MSILVEGRRSIHLAGSARLVDDSREMAWAEHLVAEAKGPDCKFVIGNYVQASTPEHPTYNSNGHEFPLGDLKHSIKGLPHRPINLLHAPGRRVGAIAAAEFVYPMGENASESADMPPIVEILGAVWAYYEPELLTSLEMAHKEGSLYFSMEAVPETITCKGKGDFAGCGRNFAYAGRTSPHYCDHLNEVASRKTLHKPLFTASALIIPPVKPGWKNATVKELSRLIESDLEAAEALYAQVEEEAPHLTQDQIDHMMAWLLATAS